jgi:hypothetical protein
LFFHYLPLVWLTPVTNLPIPVANLSLVSTTSAVLEAKFAAGVVDTCGTFQFATGVL